MKIKINQAMYSLFLDLTNIIEICGRLVYQKQQMNNTANLVNKMNAKYQVKGLWRKSGDTPFNFYTQIFLEVYQNPKRF